MEFILRNRYNAPMRHLATCLVFLFGLCVFSGLPAYAQNKTACELLSRADAEAILGVTLLPPKPSAPFRSLLDPDFTSGTPEQRCEFTNFRFSYATPNQPKPPKVVNVSLEVRYSPTPNAHAVEEARRQVDTRTYDHPTDLPGLGDAAFWIGPPNNVTLFVFLGGTTRLMIGRSEIGMEQEKALAAKALAALGKTTFTYGTPTGLKPPVLPKPGPNPSPLDQLKRALTTKAEAGDTKSQLALGRLYASGTLGQDGAVQHDYAGAAYWFQQASDHGNAQAAYELALFYHDGTGVTADPSRSFELLQKAAQGNYVPAMPRLSNEYAGQKTPVSFERATYWATRAAELGDPTGWVILGFEYNEGLLGGDRVTWPQRAMEAYKRAADGGNCVGMLQLADMYSKGAGIPRDMTAAQSWQAKAEACQDGSLTSLQQQLAQFRGRAAAQRLPMVDAIPAVPNTAPVVARNGHRPADATAAKVFSMMAVGFIIAGALVALTPDSPTPTSNAFNPERCFPLPMDQYGNCYILNPPHEVVTLYRRRVEIWAIADCSAPTWSRNTSRQGREEARSEAGQLVNCRPGPSSLAGS